MKLQSEISRGISKELEREERERMKKSGDGKLQRERKREE